MGEAKRRKPGSKKSPGSISRWTRQFLEQVHTADGGPVTTSASVPCGGCISCCTHPGVAADLREDELPEFPDAVWDDFNERWELPRQADQSCAYLIDSRCSIYHRRPRSCRTYDCRTHLMARIPPAPAWRQHLQEVYEMWGDWEVKTPEDVDHLFAWHRAIKEGLGVMMISGSADLGLAHIVARFRVFLKDAHEMRDAVGYQAARELALMQDRAVRRELAEIVRHSKIGLEADLDRPPATWTQAEAEEMDLVGAVPIKG